MTAEEFNTKWAVFLEPGFSGLEIDENEITLWLDQKFSEFSKRENFTYMQIKLKFGMCRFYATGVTGKEISEVEQFIDNAKV
jgi:hypothetical protein